MDRALEAGGMFRRRSQGPRRLIGGAGVEHVDGYTTKTGKHVGGYERGAGVPNELTGRVAPPDPVTAAAQAAASDPVDLVDLLNDMPAPDNAPAPPVKVSTTEPVPAPKWKPAKPVDSSVSVDSLEPGEAVRLPNGNKIARTEDGGYRVSGQYTKSRRKAQELALQTKPPGTPGQRAAHQTLKRFDDRARVVNPHPFTVEWTPPGGETRRDVFNRQGKAEHQAHMPTPQEEDEAGVEETPVVPTPLVIKGTAGHENSYVHELLPGDQVEWVDAQGEENEATVISHPAADRVHVYDPMSGDHALLYHSRVTSAYRTFAEPEERQLLLANAWEDARTMADEHGESKRGQAYSRFSQWTGPAYADWKDFVAELNDSGMTPEEEEEAMAAAAKLRAYDADGNRRSFAERVKELKEKRGRTQEAWVNTPTGQEWHYGDWPFELVHPRSYAPGANSKFSPYRAGARYVLFKKDRQKLTPAAAGKGSGITGPRHSISMEERAAEIVSEYL